MLTAFNTHPLVELKQRDKSKIESLLAFGNQLLVGLNTGSLRIYRVNVRKEEEPPQNDDQSQESEPDSAKFRPVDLLREIDKFSKKPIQQLALFKEAAVLISLSDGYVSLYNLKTLELEERLDVTSGASLFAVTSNIEKDDEMNSIVSRLAVAVKRRILIWSWLEGELTGSANEMILEHAVKSLTWATGTTLIAGLDSGFVKIDLKFSSRSKFSKVITDIIKPGPLVGSGSKFGAVSSTGMSYVGMGSWVPKPLATKLANANQQLLLLAKDINTLFIETNGKPIDRRQIPWTYAPEALAYYYPYLLALQPSAKGTLEIRSPKTTSLLQSISLQNAHLIHVPQSSTSLAHTGKCLLIASDRCIWQMNALPYESQIEQLVSQSLYDEAIDFILLLEDTLLLDKYDRLRDVRILKALALFKQQRYQESLKLFEDCHAPPKIVIELYPKSIAGELSSIPEPDSDTEDDHHSSTKSPPNSPHLTPRKLATSMLGTFRFRPDAKKDSDTTSIKTADTVAKPDASLESKDLILATDKLCEFLADTRRRMRSIIKSDGVLEIPLDHASSNGSLPEWRKLIVLEDGESQVDWHKKLLEVASMVDTVLFRAYMQAKPSLAGPLFRQANFCDAKVVRDKLYETGRYVDLVEFLHGKKLHLEALEMLQKFGQDETNESINPVLRGPRRTVAYLQQLPPSEAELIFKFAEWPLKKDLDAGMEVFTADTQNAEDLPKHEVLAFLTRMGYQYAIKYLEHLITELHQKNPEFHKQLIQFYLERLTVGKKAKPDYGGFANEGEKLEYKHKLESFLRSSDQYRPSILLEQLPKDDVDFHESRAIVYSKMGQYKQALQIYVFDLQDNAKAEECCSQVFLASKHPSQSSSSSHTPITPKPQNQSNDNTKGPQSIYFALLFLYLTPPPPHAQQLNPALELLSAHGPRLPAGDALFSLLPPTISIHSLQSYFRGRMRREVARCNEQRVVAQLRKVRDLETQDTLLREKAGWVMVDDEKICEVCKKRFAEKTAVRVENTNRGGGEGRVVHYACSSRGGLGSLKRMW